MLTFIQKQKGAEPPETPVVSHFYFLKCMHKPGAATFTAKKKAILYTDKMINEHLWTFVCEAGIWRSSLAS